MRFGDVDALPVECLAVLLVLLRFRESADIDPVVDGHFRFVTFRISFEFVRFNVDGHVVLAVSALVRRGFRRPIRENGDVFEQIF